MSAPSRVSGANALEPGVSYSAIMSRRRPAVLPSFWSFCRRSRRQSDGEWLVLVAQREKMGRCGQLAKMALKCQTAYKETFATSLGDRDAVNRVTCHIATHFWNLLKHSFEMYPKKHRTASLLLLQRNPLLKSLTNLWRTVPECGGAGRPSRRPGAPSACPVGGRPSVSAGPPAPSAGASSAPDAAPVFREGQAGVTPRHAGCRKSSVASTHFANFEDIKNRIN